MPLSKDLCFVLFLVQFLTISGCTQPGPENKNTFEVEKDLISRLLSQQVIDWNNGDIPAYMLGYLGTDSLRFVSGGTVRSGWEATVERYLNAYPDKKAMGALTFENVDIRPLSGNWAYVFGQYQLRREGDFLDKTGLFTLILQKRPEGWRIVHDHTSTEH